MGGSKKVTVGYWYKLLYHAGLGYPIDAFLEFRGGDRTAWSGELTSTGTININAPDLWGGQKDQGGIVGPVDIMFGDADQMPNPYLVSKLGSQVSAWRGFTTLVFKGGKYGAMNPYPQKASYKIRKILNGWDDGCWYPEKAVIQAAPAVLLDDQATGWLYQQIPHHANPATTNLSVPWTGWSLGQAPFGSHTWTYPGQPAAIGSWAPGTILWIKRRVTIPNSGVTVARVYAENGCVVLANGLVVGSINPTNVQLSDGGTADIVLPPGSYTLAIKAFDESPTLGYTYLGVKLIHAPGKSMNPAHVLYYARTHSTLGREPIGNLNDASYRAAADRLFDEGFGICTSLDPSKESLDDFETRIGRLIGGSVSRSLVDGQWYLDLARGDYDLEALPVLTDDDILDFEEQPTTFQSAVNSLAVRYFNPASKENVVTPAVRALGLIREFGEISQINDYLEIPTARLALLIAERDLRASVTPTRAFKLKTTRKPNPWRPGTYFRLQCPKRGIADMVCVVGEKQSGQLRSGAMSLTATQDIYGMPTASYVDVEPGVDTAPGQVPNPIELQHSFELPYIAVVSSFSASDLADLPAEAGFVATVAADPETSRDYSLMVSAAGAETYVDAGDGEWCPTAVIVEASTTRTETAFTLNDGFKLDSVAVGSAALWGDEIVRVDAIDEGAGTVTLGRGCADTVSAAHAAGERIWFFGEAAAVGPTEYSAAESIDIKLLTNTGSGKLDLISATAMTLTFNERLHRPYPPGKLKIDGSDYPASVDGEFVITWAHRNRETQADQLIDATLASVTPANNVRYGLRFKRVDTGAVLVERNDIGPATATVQLAYTGNVRLELWTLDNDAVSWQTHVHEFAYAADIGVVASTITATAYTPVDDAIIIDGGGD